MDDIWESENQIIRFVRESGSFGTYPCDCEEVPASTLQDVTGLPSNVVTIDYIRRNPYHVRFGASVDSERNSIDCERRPSPVASGQMRAEGETADLALQLVLDTIPALILTSRSDGWTDYVNRQWRECFGLTLDEAAGWGWIQTVHPADRQSHIQEWRNAVATGEPFERETRLLRADGSYQWFLHRATPLRNGQGLIIRWMGTTVAREHAGTANATGLPIAARSHFLSRRIIEIQESERRHLARELHDEIGQILTGLRLQLKPKPALTATAASRAMEEARLSIDELLERVRGLSFDLRPAVLDQLGLLPALLALFERYTNRTGVLVCFKHHDLEQRFATELETVSYRIVQECLTNIARHAGVAGALVRIWVAAHSLNIQIEDRGCGFDVESAMATHNCAGLAGMQERAALMGGSVSIDSKPGEGTQITAEIPIPSQLIERKAR